VRVRVQGGNSLEHTPVDSFTPLSTHHIVLFFILLFQFFLLFFFTSIFFISTFYFLLAIFSTSFRGLRGCCWLSRKQAV
jgi:hypothetical protein